MIRRAFITVSVIGLLAYVGLGVYAGYRGAGTVHSEGYQSCPPIEVPRS